MKASKFPDAQKAFILKQGEEGTPVAEIHRNMGISHATNNAFIEAFNGRFRTECLTQHWFMNLADAAEKLKAWRTSACRSRVVRFESYCRIGPWSIGMVVPGVGG